MIACTDRNRLLCYRSRQYREWYMSLAGIRSNRGDAYQTLVALDWALRVLADTQYTFLEVDSSSTTAGGSLIPVDDVVVSRRDGSLIACQCKKNHPHFQAWTVKDLAAELVKAADFLSKNLNSEARFYSRNNFGSLGKLREHAATQPDEMAYLASLTAEHQETNNAFSAAVSSATALSTYVLLQRLKFQVTPEFEEMQELLIERLSRLASNAETVLDVLWTRLDRLGSRVPAAGVTEALSAHRLSRDDLLTHLANAGGTLVPPKSQQELQSTFRQTSAIGRSWRRDIGGTRLHAEAVDELLGAINTGAKAVLLAGLPGSGKTCVLLELQDMLEQRNGVAAMFIQGREFAHCETSAERDAHGLPIDLVGQVGRMADTSRTVVIIDSLDVLSLSRDHEVLSYFLAQIDRLLLLPRVTVIAACRDFDRKYDTRIAGRKWDRIVVAQPFDSDRIVTPLLNSFGIDLGTLDDITRAVITNPRELAMFVDVVRRSGRLNVSTSQELSRRYLETLVRDDPALGDPALGLIENIADSMLKARRLDLPRSQLGLPDHMLLRLLSVEVLHPNSSGRIEFGHQTLLDVLVVSRAERRGLTLKALIEELPPVPFVRPTIRAYVAFLAAAGDRAGLRRQLRAVAESAVAFHLRRLVVESFADLVPHDDDWGLISRLRQQQRALFDALYWHADAPAWHHFWLRFLVPAIVQQRDWTGLETHVRRVASWKTTHSASVIDFWTASLRLDWADRDSLARNLSLELSDFAPPAGVHTTLLVEALLELPHQDHDLLGRAVARCVEAGGPDSLLWKYITSDFSDTDVFGFRMDDKLRCEPHIFGTEDFLALRMKQSVALLDLAIGTIERWSAALFARYPSSHGWNADFLDNTSFGNPHPADPSRHTSAQMVLFQAVETAIGYHAGENSAWWVEHRHALGESVDGALRFCTIKALIAHPVSNLSVADALLVNEKMLTSPLGCELGALLTTSFWYLAPATQDTILGNILAITQRDREGGPWLLECTAEFIRAIPACFRSLEADSILTTYQRTHGAWFRQRALGSGGGLVTPPFSFERFLEASDLAVLRLVSHYRGAGAADDWEGERLIGGAEQVAWQLREAAARHPLRFLELLRRYWATIPSRFRDELLSGASTYLSYRYGNLQTPPTWVPFRDADAELLAQMLLDEMERHPTYWLHHRVAASTLVACAHVVLREDDAYRLIFACIGYHHFGEADRENGSRDLITTGINMVRGDVAEALMVMATRWAKDGKAFPQLLPPALRQLAKGSSSAIRAVMLRRLADLQYLVPELGWELYDIVMEDPDSRLWKVAERCLYYAYNKNYQRVASNLLQMIALPKGESDQTWARISALAALSGHVALHEFLSDLSIRQSVDAWRGALDVWVHNAHLPEHHASCFDGIASALQAPAEVSMLARERTEHLYRHEKNVVRVPFVIVDRYLQILSANTSTNIYLHWFPEWMNALGQICPDEALVALERFARFVLETNYRLSSQSGIAQLLTRLFREAEEAEEADGGKMLDRVVKVQDELLVSLSGLQQWLRDAERP
jgi:hypothetical protein